MGNTKNANATKPATMAATKPATMAATKPATMASTATAATGPGKPLLLATGPGSVATPVALGSGGSNHGGPKSAAAALAVAKGAVCTVAACNGGTAYFVAPTAATLAGSTPAAWQPTASTVGGATYANPLHGGCSTTPTHYRMAVVVAPGAAPVLGAVAIYQAHTKNTASSACQAHMVVNAMPNGANVPPTAACKALALALGAKGAA